LLEVAATRCQCRQHSIPLKPPGNQLLHSLSLDQFELRSIASCLRVCRVTLGHSWCSCVADTARQLPHEAQPAGSGCGSATFSRALLLLLLRRWLRRRLLLLLRLLLSLCLKLRNELLVGAAAGGSAACVLPLPI
jgi:hypothetical protein